MLDDFVRFLAHFDQHDLRQGQREALLDALLLVMLADRNVRFDEETFVRGVATHLRWEGERPVWDHLDQARPRIAAALEDPEQLAVLVADIDARLQDHAAAKKRVYLLCDEMANRDREVAPEERAVLAALLDAFGS